MSYKSSVYQPLYDGFDLIVDGYHYICFVNLEKERLYKLIKTQLISINPDIQFIFNSFIKSYYDIVFLNKKTEEIINNFINQYETLLTQYDLFTVYIKNHTIRELLINTYYFIYKNYLENL